METEEEKLPAGVEAPEAAKLFKPSGLTQASFSYKAIPVASGANAASQIITGFMEKHLLQRALEVPPETCEPPSCSQRWLDRPVQVSAAMELGFGQMVPRVGETIEELGFDVDSQMAKVGIEDSLAETSCTYQDIPAKRPRLYQTISDGLPSQDTATVPKNLILTVDPLQSMPTKEEQAEKPQRIKDGRKDKKSKVDKKKERKMLHQKVYDMSRYMSGNNRRK